MLGQSKRIKHETNGQGNTKISNFDKTYIIQFNANCHKLVESQEI